MTEPYDVLTMGRIGVDLYPREIGVPLRDVETFGKYLGGTATNVAVAAARHGRRSAVITRTGADPFGEFLHDALRRFEVDDRYVTAVPGLPTPLAFCEIFPPDDFPLYFYRYPTAPDLQIHAGELDWGAIRAARVFWVTATGLSAEPSRTATLRALEHRGRAGITVLDLDYRPMFWPSRAPPASPARTPCPAPPRSRHCSGRPRVRESQLRVLVATRVHRAGDIAAAAARRVRPTSLVGDHGRLMMIGAAYARRRKALALPTVAGPVIGRSLLYPPDDDVASAVDTAVGLP
jgi:hypothetical protein